jgi:DNA-binding Xre family transcriptional regulator
MNRNAILQHIDFWAKKLGSYSKVAEKAGISDTALSQLKSGKYGANEDQLLQKLASALDFKHSSWVIVPEISNYIKIKNAYSNAKNESMWIMISNKAGSGKTGTMQDIYNNDTSGSVFYVPAEEWSGRQFLLKIVKITAGESVLKGTYKTNTELIQIIADFFNEKQFLNPVLMIDETDKLKPNALGVLVPLFNKTEDRLGLLACGTENLEKEIKAGVRLAKKRYDEIDSRFGRNFLTLNGITEEECSMICTANGVDDPFTQSQIWLELEPVKKVVKVKTPKGEKEKQVYFAEDLRRLKRIVKRELIKNKRVA